MTFKGYNAPQAFMWLVVIFLAIPVYTGAKIAMSPATFDTVFTAASVLYFTLAVLEKKSGKGSFFEVYLSGLVYFGYGYTYNGIKSIPGFNQYSYAILVGAFWILYNGTGEIDGWMRLPKRFFAFIRSKIKALKLPKVSLPKLPKVSMPKPTMPKMGKPALPKGKADTQKPVSSDTQKQTGPVVSPKGDTQKTVAPDTQKATPTATPPAAGKDKA